MSIHYDAYHWHTRTKITNRVKDKEIVSEDGKTITTIYKNQVAKFSKLLIKKEIEHSYKSINVLDHYINGGNYPYALELKEKELSGKNRRFDLKSFKRAIQTKNHLLKKISILQERIL